MDITAYVSNNRDRAFLVGSYGSYRTQLSRQILSLRHKLGRTTPKNKKPAKQTIDVEDVARNPLCVHLLLLQAERAWAQAMQMKSARAEDSASAGVSGSTRSHILSRLHKAASFANSLVAILTYKSAAGASTTDYLEAVAYAACLSGAEQFEKHVARRYEDAEAHKAAWEACLVKFSEAHVIYAALGAQGGAEVYREWAAGNVEPSLRYAAYQAGMPRSIPLASVAKRYFPRERKALVEDVENLAPGVLTEEAAAASAASPDGTTTTTSSSSPTGIPSTTTWRGRPIPLSDASIAQALSTTSAAAARLAAALPALSSPSALAAAYDPVLTAAQDAVDAVRRALGDAGKEGLPESSPRVQELRRLDLAANHALVAWRVGRNRVLMSDGAAFPGVDDGLGFTAQPPPAAAGSSAGGGSDAAAEGGRRKGETPTHALGRLRQRTALQDATIQSLGALRGLPGAAGDAGFMREVEGAEAYFRAVRCLGVGYAFVSVGRHREGLGLFDRAGEVAEGAMATEAAAGGEAKAPSAEITPAQVAALKAKAAEVTARQRGLVALLDAVGTGDTTTAGTAGTAGTASAGAPPLSDTLTAYPTVDTTNLVPYPAQMAVAPVRPVFLDLAWNYVSYPSPGSGSKVKAGAVAGVVDGAKKVVEEAAGKAEEVGEAAEKKGRGWFGFGR